MQSPISFTILWPVFFWIFVQPKYSKSNILLWQTRTVQVEWVKRWGVVGKERISWESLDKS